MAKKIKIGEQEVVVPLKQEIQSQVDNSIDTHNDSETSHEDIRLLISSLNADKLNKNFTSLIEEVSLTLSDVFVVDKGSGARKVSLGNLASYLSAQELELFTIVEELPTVNQNPNTIYLLVTENEDGENQLLEYIWIANQERWELIGSLEVDLSNYYTKAEVNGLLEDNQKLFIVTYGTTPHALITTALSENKIPVCYYNNFWYVFVGQFGTGPDYLLCNMYPDSVRTIRVTPYNAYTTTKTDFETIVNKTNILNASSTTTQYPNAKIVYDTFKTKQDALTAGDRISISGNVISAVGGYEPDEDTIILNENDELEATNVMIWGYE